MKLQRRLYKMEKTFVPASGGVNQKQCLFGFFGYGIWEFTWSPSLGVDALSLHRALTHFLPDSSAEAVIQNHLSWIRAIDEIDEMVVTGTSRRGREFGIGTQLIVNPKDEFIRIKCKQKIPVQEILNVAYGIDVILDFNGTANFNLLEEGVRELRKSNQIGEIYIEEPFLHDHVPTSWGCKRIFDRRNVSDLLRSDQLLPGDIFTLKVGRNSFDEYKLLAGSNLPVILGQDIASPCGDAIMSILNAKLSTFQLDVIKRDCVEPGRPSSNVDISFKALLKQLRPWGRLIETTCAHKNWNI